MKCQTLFSWTIRNNIRLPSTVFVQRVLRLKKQTSNSVFRESRCPPPTHPPPELFSFSTALTIKIRSISPKSNQIFVMSPLYNP